MPQLAVTALTSFFVGLGASAAVATFAATVFVYAATAYLLNRIAQNAARPTSGLGSGTEVNYYDSGAGGRIAYGLVKTGGMETIPALTGGSNNEILVKALSLTIHEVDSYRSFGFDDKTINYSALTAVTATSADGNVNSGQFSNHAWIRAYRGTSTDSADYRLRNGGFGAFFDTNFRGRGIAKVLVDFKFNRDVYQAVPIVTATYQGKRCYDPRLDVTPGASPTNASYIAWTRNPALTLADYLMATYGGEYESDDIDWATVVTAANYCDGLVNIPGATTQARYTCNGVLMATDQFEDNVKTLVNAMLGRVIFHDGKWRVHAGSWQTPTFTIQKTDWIKGGLSIKFEQGRKVRFNRMRAWYVDPNRDWQRVQSTARYNSTYQAADFDTIDAETDQVLCTNEYEAQRKSEFLLRASRNQIVVVGRLPPRFQDIAMWDTGTIVFDHLGWSSKTFRAVGIDMNPDGSMDCVFQEEQSTDWTDMDAADYNTESTASLPAVNATSPTAPPGFSATPQVNGTILFNWTTPVVKPLNTEFQIIRSTNSADASVGTIVWQGLANPVPLVMPTSQHWYYVRSIANSAYSPYMPNTFGVSVGARPEADNSFAARMIPDEFFGLSTAQSYWYWGAATGVSISATGGVVQGKLSLTGNGTTKEIESFRVPPYPVVTGQQFSIRVRWRRTGTITVNSTTDIFAVNYRSVLTSPYGGTSVGQSAIFLTGAQVNSVNVNEWQEHGGTITVTNVAKSSAQYPYGIVTIVLGANATAGVIEISDVTASRI